MKLLRAIHTLSATSGGPIEGIRQISPFLKDLGVETTIATLDAPETDLPSDPSYTIEKLGPTNGHLGSSQAFSNWVASKAGEFDAAIIHGLWLFNGYGFWKANKTTSIPYFLYPHGMLDPWFKKTYPIKHLKKFAYWLLRERKLARDAQHVLFTSEEEKLRARKTFSPYKVNERVVKYGIATPPADKESCIDAFEKLFPETQNQSPILFLSRIHEKKGCDILLNSFARLRQSRQIPNDQRLVMAGPPASDKYLASLKALASNLNIARNITWTGMLQGQAKYGALYQASILALPSHQENFGIAVAEALACGLPVVTTKEVNIWREIESDGGGIITINDQENFDRGLESYFQKSTVQRELMTLSAKTCFENRFHIKSAAEDLYQILQAVSR